MLLIVCGPSGAGKGTLTDLITSQDHRIIRVPSCTTREPRAAETEGVDYHFLSEDQFRTFQAQGDTFGGSRKMGFVYSLRKSQILRAMSRSPIVLVETDLPGVAELKAAFRDVLAVFISAPSIDDLLDRLRKRNRDRPEEVAERIADSARILACPPIPPCDKVIVNREVEQSLVEFRSLLDDFSARLVEEGGR
jgi:guanylate kinase